jgi:hypothetical protein
MKPVQIIHEGGEEINMQLKIIATVDQILKELLEDVEQFLNTLGKHPCDPVLQSVILHLLASLHDVCQHRLVWIFPIVLVLDLLVICEGAPRLFISL